MYFINFNFTLIKPIGSLSESRIGILKNMFSDNFPEIIQPADNTIIFRKGATALIISPDQIVFAFQGNENEINFEEITSTLVHTNEALGLSNKAIIIQRLEAIESIKVNSLEKSKEIIKDFNDSQNVDGVGLRLIITTHPNFHGDIRVEPFIKDANKVFYQVALDSRGEILISDAKEKFKEMYNFSIQKAREVSKNLFSI
ncbi:hypothetical protein G4Z05_00400 [Bacillus thermocopriae]|uniref:Uncharacterized protein n=1 Tax=Neobacillus thermocopriae TaxID=1215031 RepID=A0A6B3TKD9_9BACI|nr:hypothetical protein [Neobacillus thermocopriae]NEX77363.1 hypothetical protein [Neobacillus thermocopriae]